MSLFKVFIERLNDIMRRWLHPRYAWKRMINQLPVKMVCLGAAFGFWFFATNERRAIIEQTYPVDLTIHKEVKSVTEESGQKKEVRIVTMKEKAKKVKVTLRGRSERLNEIKPGIIEASIDLTEVPNDTRFDVPVNVVAPANTELVKKDPERVQGNVDIEVSRDFPVTIGTVAQDISKAEKAGRYIAVGRQVNLNDMRQPYVKIRGTGQTIDQVKTVLTLPVFLKEGQTRQVGLIALDAKGQQIDGVRFEPNLFTVERLETRLISIKAPLTPAGYVMNQVKMQPSKVRVVARASQFNQLKAVQVASQITPNKIKNKYFKGLLELKQPKEFILLDKTVQATIQLTKLPPLKVPSIEEKNTEDQLSEQKKP